MFEGIEDVAAERLSGGWGGVCGLYESADASRPANAWRSLRILRIRRTPDGHCELSEFANISCSASASGSRILRICERFRVRRTPGEFALTSRVRTLRVRRHCEIANALRSATFHVRRALRVCAHFESADTTSLRSLRECERFALGGHFEFANSLSLRTLQVRRSLRECELFEFGGHLTDIANSSSSGSLHHACDVLFRCRTGLICVSLSNH